MLIKLGSSFNHSDIFSISSFTGVCYSLGQSAIEQVQQIWFKYALSQ